MGSNQPPSQPPQKIFSRNSSGLVREISTSQAFIYNFMAIGFYGFTWATLFSVGYTSSFLGANIGLAILLMAVSAIPFYVSTSMLSSAMPRAGGDYVWQSRVLHPSIGFASTFSAWTVWQWYFASFLGVVMTTIGYQPLFALLGLTNAGDANFAGQSAAGFGQYDNTLVFEITTLIIILGFAVAALGIRFYVRLQYLLFAGSAISALTLLGVLATTSHAAFVSSLNSFTAPLIAAGNQSQISTANVNAAGGYYQYIINTANLHSSSFSLENTLFLFGIIWLSFGYAFWSIYNLGEIKRAGNLRAQADNANRICSNFRRIFARTMVSSRSGDWAAVLALILQPVFYIRSFDQPTGIPLHALLSGISCVYQQQCDSLDADFGWCDIWYIPGHTHSLLRVDENNARLFP